MKTKRKHKNAATYIVLLVFALVILIPFIWMILTAFKTKTESTSLNPFVIFPSTWSLDAFERVLSKLDFKQLYLNTILMIAGRVLCAVVTSTLAGYALARLQFPGKKIAFALVMFQMMVPSQVFIIPQYLMVNKLGLLNSTFSLIFPGIVSAFGTFLMRQAFMTMPRDLEEAARLDGCNIGQTFLHIMLPLARSNMVALAIFTALFAYKDLMWPIVANTDQTTTSLSARLAKLQGGQFLSDYPGLMAGALMASLLMVVLYLIFQKQFIEGIATSGGKL